MFVLPLPDLYIPNDDSDFKFQFGTMAHGMSLEWSMKYDTARIFDPIMDH